MSISSVNLYDNVYADFASGAEWLWYPSGHPPLWFVLAEGVVLASFVLAPIGVMAAVVNLVRARRRENESPRPALIGLGVNLLFLLAALAFWVWLQSMSA